MKVDIRFLRQGLIEAETPKGFEEMSKQKKIEWAQQILNDKSDKELIQAMSDFREGINQFFDETPTVEAIEGGDEDDAFYGCPIVQTKAWQLFASLNSADIVE